MKNIAIIPARGGSKRIPRKNIKPFLGKPIIAYSIDAAIKTGLFDEVMVSTDDEEIADVARQYGAVIPFMRSGDTANDFAVLKDVLLEVVDCYNKNNRFPQYVCCILPTAPLISPVQIMEAYHLLLNSDNCNSVYPVTAFSYPILRSLNMDADGFLRMNWSEHLNTRSQDLPPAYHDTGTFYWHKAEIFTDKKALLAKGIIVDEITVQDIDTETDWKLAELKYKLLNDNR